MADDGTGTERDGVGGEDGRERPPSASSDSSPDLNPNSNANSNSNPTADATRSSPDDGTGRERIPIDLSSDGDTDEDDAYTPEPGSTPIEAGDPDLENAVFVVLGALAMILVIARLVALPL